MMGLKKRKINNFYCLFDQKKILPEEGVLLGFRDGEVVGWVDGTERKNKQLRNWENIKC